jgi:site-specific DNA-methyltransferase (adenine-specific)
MPGVGRPRRYPDLQTKWRENQRRYRKAKQKAEKVYHRQLKTEWETPQWFFDQYNAEFGFTLDVCASPLNAKCARYFTRDQDGLAQPWEVVCWMNPPYGRAVDRWLAKAHASAQAGATVVCLVKAGTDTQWWHTFKPLASDVRFVEKRLKFGDAENTAAFPSVVMIFRPQRDSAAQAA